MSALKAITPFGVVAKYTLPGKSAKVSQMLILPSVITSSAKQTTCCACDERRIDLLCGMSSALNTLSEKTAGLSIIPGGWIKLLCKK